MYNFINYLGKNKRTKKDISEDKLDQMLAKLDNCLAIQEKNIQTVDNILNIIKK